MPATVLLASLVGVSGWPPPDSTRDRKLLVHSLRNETRFLQRARQPPTRNVRITLRQTRRCVRVGHHSKANVMRVPHRAQCHFEWRLAFLAGCAVRRSALARSHAHRVRPVCVCGFSCATGQRMSNTEGAAYSIRTGVPAPRGELVRKRVPRPSVPALISSASCCPGCRKAPAALHEAPSARAACRNGASQASTCTRSASGGCACCPFACNARGFAGTRCGAAGRSAATASSRRAHHEKQNEGQNRGLPALGRSTGRGVAAGRPAGHAIS